MTDFPNAPPIVPLILLPGHPPIFVRSTDEADAAALIKGERGLIQEKGQPFVRRVLDLGAREGAFQYYCRFRFPYAWVDSVETNEELRELAALNALPGNRTFAEVPEAKPKSLDLVRLTGEWSESEDVVLDLRPALIFYDGCFARPNGYVQLAGGMRRKGEPFSWWQREEEKTP